MKDLRKILIDLRKSYLDKIAAINIKPTDHGEKNYHLAIADYLYKEFKYNGLKVSKNQVTVKVSLKNKHLNKYEHVIIDCLDGKIYLRGKEVNDKYFGKLRKFNEGRRASDAYSCVVNSATRIINRIKRIEDMLEDDEREVLAINIERIDLRNQVNRTDLRKNLNKIANIQRIDLRKTANIQIIDLQQRNVTDLRKAANINRKDLRKTAINKFAMDVSFLNNLATNLQTIYTSVQNITSNNDIQSTLNFVSQFGDDILQKVPMLKNIKPAIDYLANLINGFQTKAPEIIEDIQNLADSSTSPIRKFRYEVLDGGTFNVAKIIRKDMRKIA